MQYYHFKNAKLGYNPVLDLQVLLTYWLPLKWVLICQLLSQIPTFFANLAPWVKWEFSTWGSCFVLNSMYAIDAFGHRQSKYRSLNFDNAKKRVVKPHKPHCLKVERIESATLFTKKRTTFQLPTCPNKVSRGCLLLFDIQSSLIKSN